MVVAMVFLTTGEQTKEKLLVPHSNSVPSYLFSYSALQQLRGQDDVEDELEELRQEDLAETEEKCMNIFQLLCFPALRWQYLSVCVLVLGHELSGIHVVSPKRLWGGKARKKGTLFKSRSKGSGVRVVLLGCLAKTENDIRGVFRPLIVGLGHP